MNDRSGSDTRQRRIMLSARFNEQEAKAIRQMAGTYGVPVGSFLRETALNRQAPRRVASKRELARLVGEIGRLGDIIHTAAAAGTLDLAHPVIAAAMRDLADMRAACFEALGMRP